MEHLRWSTRPKLRRPALVAAFGGWNDAGDAATIAVGHLASVWNARPFASIDPEEFYDFTAQRPQVRLKDGFTREIVWPTNELTAAHVTGTDRDAILLVGLEPHLRWRTFCAQIIGVARELGCELIVTLGALLADVPHRRPVQIIGTAGDTALIERFGLERSRYEGPTGIVGTLVSTCGDQQMPALSLWAAVPSYASSAPSPKAALALVERVGEVLGADIPVTGLQIAAAAYERQIDAAVEGDDDLRSYVERIEAGLVVDDDEDDDDLDEDDLEEEDDEAELVDEESAGAELVEEVERFLRDQN